MYLGEWEKVRSNLARIPIDEQDENRDDIFITHQFDIVAIFIIGKKNTFRHQ